MPRETSLHQKPILWRELPNLKALLVTLSLLGLMASNVASLVNASAHDWMHNSLWRVLSIGGNVFADRALKNSPKGRLDETVKVKTVELDTQNKRLAASYDIQAKELEATRSKSQKLAQQLDVYGKQAKITVATVHQRLAKSVSRNVAALPSEAVPYLGISVALAVTSLDIYDACQTMNDFNTLLQMMGQGEEHPELCGQKVPTADQVLAAAKTEWRTSVQRVANESKAIKVTAPEVRLPTRDEVEKVTCAAVTVPYLCAK